MAAEHDFINSLVDDHLAQLDVDWRRVMMEMAKITGGQSRESEAVLLKILGFTGEFRVRVILNHPHLLTPLESLQAQAMRALSKWGSEHRGSDYRAVIEAFANRTESDTLEFIARSYLGRAQGPARR
jgi:hypothetical protein